MPIEMRVPGDPPKKEGRIEDFGAKLVDGRLLNWNAVNAMPKSTNVEVQTRAQMERAFQTQMKDSREPYRSEVVRTGKRDLGYVYDPKYASIESKIIEPVIHEPQNYKQDQLDVASEADHLRSLGGPGSDRHKADRIYDKQTQDFKDAYPGLAEGVSIVQSPDDGSDNKLEFWPPGEEGTKDRPRPEGIPMDKPGVEVFGNKAKTLDIAGDVVSHYGVKNDPTLKAYYDKFVSSITSKQEETLKEQYDWAKKNEGETRPYKTWKDLTGLPAYFRGYTFKQWGPEAAKEMYTAEQRKNLDEVIDYITKPPKKK